MMGELMIGILNTSAVVGVSIAAAAIILGFSRKHYSAKCRKGIWIFMAFCLLIPFQLFRFPGAYTAEIPDYVLRRSESGTADHAGEQELTVPQQSVQGQPLQSQPGQNLSVQNSYVQNAPAVPEAELTVTDVIFIAWACVGILLAVWYTAGYWRMRSRIRRWSSECVNGHVWKLMGETAAECKLKNLPQLRIMQGSTEGPFTTGVFGSIIVLPDDALQEKDLRFILKHEVIHCRNHDVFWRLFLLAVNIIHWFNPLVWLLRRAAEQDMEIACDEEVVSLASGETRKEYSDVIMSWVEKSRYKGSAVSTGYVNGVKFLKRRFDSIFNGGKKKNGILLAGGVCILALVLGCVLQLQSGGRVYAKREIVIDDGFEVRTDVNGDGEAERVYVSDNVSGDYADTQVSVRFADGETAWISYPDYWESYLVTGDLSGNGAADIVLIKTARGSTYGGSEITVLHVQTDEAGKPELVEYPGNFIQNPDLELEWTGWENYTGGDRPDDEYSTAQPAGFGSEYGDFAGMGAMIIEEDGKTMLRLIAFVDAWTESVKCIDCSYTPEGWYIEDMQMIYDYWGGGWEERLLGYTWGANAASQETLPEDAGESFPQAGDLSGSRTENADPESVRMQTFAPEEVEVAPQIKQYDFAAAMETGTLLEQLQGSLPGASQGVWYTILIDGVEYYYGKYDFQEAEDAECFAYAIVSGEYSLANGISVGMTKGEVLELYPDMWIENTSRNAVNGTGDAMWWNPAAYPRSYRWMAEEWEYGEAEEYYWDSRFDYVMIADIEQDPDTLPVFMALMMKDDGVAAITFYYPTAN
ncbi:MAG: M56 family metallopeptidase [Butyrivibrio sp.]|nr:M56 family metallopeptidase [Acetatifactor muris]MCM1558830.1 M56 family metallopeptidase [Butyrivibrio sp.]